LSDETCTLCEACVDECREKAITLQKEKSQPKIDYDLCLACGKCIEACPTGTIVADKKGFKVQLGGKLGRHPQLAKELPGIYSEDEVLDIIKNCIIFYKSNSEQGARFAELFTPEDFKNFSGRYDS
ncbi:MAG: 4Fe-4S binding protein, partial [Deltaproteobacteria bacterium]|nr:4Fe-4S binding protein [Deltaproteobacteria bacterium]